MTTSEGWDKNFAVLGACLGLFLLFGLFYLLPRSGQIASTEEAIENLQTVRTEVADLLPEVARTAFTTPIPEDVRSWITANCLAGIDKNLVANDSYLEGRGAAVKLRRLTPRQTATFLSQLTQVRLVIERMELQDSDGDGRWDMQINVKVPEA